MEFLKVLLILHFVAPFIAVVSERVFEGKKRPFRGLLLLYLIIFYQAAAINIGLLLSVPLIVLTLITGPGAILGFFIAIVGLGIYVVERVANYDIRGYSFHGDDRDALFLIGLLFLSLIGFAIMWKIHDAHVMDRFPGWIGEQFRRPLQYLQEQLRETELG